MGMSTVGGFLFGLPFFGAGVWAVLAGTKTISVDPASVHAPYWVSTAFGMTFALAGLTVWGMAWKQFAASRRQIRAALLYPNEPALADFCWDREGFKVSEWPGVAKAIGVAIGLSVFLSMFNWWAFGANGPWMVKGMVVLFDLLGLGAWGYAGRQIWRAFKFGRSRVLFTQFPYRGSEVTLRWQPSKGVTHITSGTFALRCVEEWMETQGRGDNRSTTLVHEEIWSGTWVIEKPRNLTVKDDITLCYKLPAQARSTRLNADRPVFWELEVKLDLPGLDFKKTYLVPIYRLETDSSDTGLGGSQPLANESANSPARAGLTTAVALTNPPKGTWFRNEGMDTLIGASARDLLRAPGTLLIALFWNGIVGLFVLCPLGATLKLLGLPLPSWFPNPVMNNEPMGVGITIGFSLFLIPFVLIGSAMLWAFFTCVAGRVEVRIGRSEATIFSGFGPIGFRRRFNPADVKDVRLQETPSGKNEDIVIEKREGKPIKFGQSLASERRAFIAQALRGQISGLK